MTLSLIQKTADYVKKKIYNESGGHDWFHTERVWKTAAQLQALEGGNLQLIELSALLHDVADYKRYDFSEKKGALALRAMMDILEIDIEMQREIIRIINDALFIGDDTKAPETIEGKIVQDADWLDSLGAIGIARTFAAGGKLNRPMHDPLRRVRKRLNKEAYFFKQQEGTSVNYFYEKSLRLPQMMNTLAGKAIADKRTLFLEQFLEEFNKEWKGEK